MSGVSKVSLGKELWSRLKEIENATSYEEIAPIIEKTQRTLTDILTKRAGSSEFSKAIIVQFTLLATLKDKSWISSTDYRATFEKTIELGKTHKSSEDPLEAEDFLDYLNSQAKEIGLIIQ